jgi:hypothetical protein
MEREQQGRDVFAEARTRRSGVVGELWAFVRDNKKWWLIPILFVLLSFGALVVLSGTGVAPFVYTLF